MVYGEVNTFAASITVTGNPFVPLSTEVETLNQLPS
jgi:hypothetical protein